MSIPIWDKQTGEVFLRNFDQGVIDTLGATPDASVPDDPCFALYIPGVSDPTNRVTVYMNNPEQIYKMKRFPLISILREDPTIALQRWMGVGQLEARYGVSGTGLVIGGVSGFTQYVSKPQATPFDFTYNITCMDRYERNVQPILLQVLKSFPHIGKLFVKDSLGLQRTYEARSEGSLTPLKENVDPVNRIVSYTVTVRVDGEMDLTSAISTSAVTGFDITTRPLKRTR